MTTRQSRPHDDSACAGSGTIPGLANAAAFGLSGPEPSAIPVLIAVPHAGRRYPPALLARMRHPRLAPLRLEDRHVDAVARAVAQGTGATLLIAEAPRAMIDLNRAPDDVDWTMFGDRPRFGRGAADAASPPLGSSPPLGRRARSGLGLIPRRLPGLGEIWKGPHERVELEARLAQVHAPYHATLAGELDRLCNRWGAALLVDLHSMPPLVAEGGAAAAQIVVGDSFGASCAGELTGGAFRVLSSAGCRAAHNRPYAGGYGIERHAGPKRGLHALQLEIDRSCYLDADLIEPGAGMTDMIGLLTALVGELAMITAALGQRGASGWAEAAE